MTWIRVTAIPNEDHLDKPRVQFLINTDTVTAFGSAPDGHTQVYTDWNPDEGAVAMCIGETLDEIQEAIAVADAMTARLNQPFSVERVGMSIG